METPTAAALDSTANSITALVVDLDFAATLPVTDQDRLLLAEFAGSLSTIRDRALELLARAAIEAEETAA